MPDALMPSPCGAAVPNEKKAWQQPVEAGAISERGKLQVHSPC